MEMETVAAAPSSAAPPAAEKDQLLSSALSHLVQGKRHLLVKDISAAVSSLGESCQLLSEANGPICPDNAEAHFFYGKALLEQSRLELAVFDDGTSGASESKEEESDEEEDEEEEEDGDEDEEGEEKKAEDMETEEVKEEETKEAEEDLSAPSPKVGDEAPGGNAEPAAPTSSSSPAPAAPSSSTNNGGAVVQDGEKPSTSSSTGQGKEAEEPEELSSLELAWEVLDLAKLGYSAQLKSVMEKLTPLEDGSEEKGKALKTKLHLQKRLAETHSFLGEVATESENYAQAVEEFKTAIEIMRGLEGEDSREVAQYYFQVGLAHSFAKQFQDGIQSFKKAKSIIELRIRNIQYKIDNKQTAKDLGVALEDPNCTEEVEISELQALLPELDEKVADTLDAEREAKQSLEEEKQEKELALKNSPVKNPNPPAVNDISHLVKKKKKAEDPVMEEPPSKRVCVETANGTNGKEHNGSSK